MAAVESALVSQAERQFPVKPLSLSVVWRFEGLNIYSNRTKKLFCAIILHFVSSVILKSVFEDFTGSNLQFLYIK